MKFPVRFTILMMLLSGAFCRVGDASVIFRSGEKAKFIAPGEAEITGNARELFEIATKAEQDGDKQRAIKAYRTLVKKHYKDALAPPATFRMGQLLEETHEFIKAANAYRFIVENYPASPHFEESIEAQFRIGEIYLGGKKLKFLGIALTTSMDRAVEIFAEVVRTAPYGKYTARAQFNIGLAREKQGSNDAAIEAYQAVVDKFPNDPIASSAQYQIGHIWQSVVHSGVKDPAAGTKAKTAYQDFLFRYPNSEKAGQARNNLQQLDHKETMGSFSVAKFYDKQKNYRAAVIYYNEVIRQQPGSTESEQAKKRIDQLRAKVGDAALQPAFAKEEKERDKKKGEKGEGSNRTAKGDPPMRGSANDVAPLPPPETDLSLPPPASLTPDTTTAPAPPAASSAPEASPAAEASGSPGP